MKNKKVNINEKYWYRAEDLINLFKDYTKDIKKLDVKLPIDTKDENSINWAVKSAISDIKDGKFDTIAIPVNINNHFLGINRSHWTALVIKKNGEGEIQAYYNDSFGNALDKKIPKLYHALKSNNIDEVNIIDYKTHQQSNSYDCGPWTVFNLRNMVTGKKPYNSKKDQNVKPSIKEQRLKLFAKKNPDIQIENTSLFHKLNKEELSTLNRIRNKMTNIAKKIPLHKLSKIGKKLKHNDITIDK